ncbi:MAG: hypothetical protein ACYC3F_01115 [Gemmatimonadaceae bacterium]
MIAAGEPTVVDQQTSIEERRNMPLVRDISELSGDQAKAVIARAVEVFRGWGTAEGRSYADFYEAAAKRPFNAARDMRRLAEDSLASSTSVIGRAVAGEVTIPLYMPPQTPNGQSAAAVIEAHLLGEKADVESVKKTLPLVEKGLSGIAMRQLKF